MSWFYRTFMRPILFAQDSETVHQRTLKLLHLASRYDVIREIVESLYGAPELAVNIFGLHFPNPVGLAAGIDKHAEAVPIWQALGFGYLELGGVTWHPQPGNPKPRIFRAIEDEAIINRMGFNNPGAEVMAATLAGWRSAGSWPKQPVGINLGKSKITPLENAAEDYANSFRLLAPLADFFVVNVSSPNTPNLRQLQDKAALNQILLALQQVNQSMAQRRPILVKVAPDLALEALDEILELAGPCELAGIVATNTTITRPHTKNPELERIYSEAGGLSGKPLRQHSTQIIRHLYRQTKGALPIIGVGGIFSAEDAWEKITAGASLIQVYTGMIYQGPSVAKEIVKGLKQRLDQHGFKSLLEAVGTNAYH